MNNDGIKHDLETIASSAAQKAVYETFMKLGIDTSDPLRAQKDFALLSSMRNIMEDEQYKADMAHLRKWRLLVDKAYIHLFLIIVGGLGVYFMDLFSRIKK